MVNLLEELQEKFGLTYLFIAHDLSMVRHISQRVAVMYLGVIVELAERDELYDHPLHPYTHALLSAIPVADPILDSQRKRVILEGRSPRLRIRPLAAGSARAARLPRRSARWRDLPCRRSRRGTLRPVCSQIAPCRRRTNPRDEMRADRKAGAAAESRPLRMPAV